MKKDPALTKEQLTNRLAGMEAEVNRLQNEIVRLDGEKYEIERRAKAEGYQEAIREVMNMMREIIARAIIVQTEKQKVYPVHKWEDIVK